MSKEKKEQGAHDAGKPNTRELPKPEAVHQVDPKENAGAAIKEARRQNTSDGKSYPKGRNVIENSHDDSILTHDRGGEDATGHE